MYTIAMVNSQEIPGHFNTPRLRALTPTCLAREQAVIQAKVDKEEQARLLLERKTEDDSRRKTETWVSTHFHGL